MEARLKKQCEKNGEMRFLRFQEYPVPQVFVRCLYIEILLLYISVTVSLYFVRCLYIEIDSSSLHL